MNADELFTPVQLERFVVTALKKTIREHGPVEFKNLFSAAKRVAGTIRGELKSVSRLSAAGATANAVIQRLQKKLDEAEARNHRLNASNRLLHERLQENQSETHCPG